MTLRLADFEAPPKLEKAEYEARLADLQQRLAVLQSHYVTQGLKGIVALEGWDASGKGGLIRRMTAELDPRFTSIHSIGAPTKEELDRHYLWRFWKRLPAAREIAVFDRTWYGRVLVERVDGLIPELSWRRAYDEINAFEALQAADGVRIVKLFLHITQEEQDKQLRERLETPWKRWKTGLDDYHNRSMRAPYMAAYEEMLARTSTEANPWTVIASDNKKHARLAGMEAVLAGLGREVDTSYPPIDAELRRVAEAALGGPPLQL